MTFSFALPSELPRHNTGCFMGLRLTVLSKLIAVKHPKIGCDGIEPSSTTRYSKKIISLLESQS